MSAREVAAALGGGCREGRNWRVSCPLHGGKSLALADGRSGLLVRCWGGCDARDILAELRDRGLIEGPSGAPDPVRLEGLRKREAAAKAEAERIRRRIVGARAVYRRGQSAAGSPVEAYLRSRGIVIAVPPVLRWVRDCPHRAGGYHPAMVAPIVDVSGEQIGVHKTFLRPDGSGKAELPKAEQRETCGALKGGVMRLAVPRGGLILIAEGIETTLSATQMFGLPGWAAIYAGGIETIELPEDVRSIIVAADNDKNSVGLRAALKAYERLREEGRSVEILLPPNAGQDFNDVLQGSE